MWGYLKTFFFFSKNGSKKRKLKLDWPIRSEQLTAIFHLIPPPLRIVQRRTKENLLKAFYSRPYVHEKKKGPGLYDTACGLGQHIAALDVYWTGDEWAISLSSLSRWGQVRREFKKKMGRQALGVFLLDYVGGSVLTGQTAGPHNRCVQETHT